MYPAMSFSREKANARERCRQKLIGNAFNMLRNHLPKQLRDRKPSKAETLKSAVQYISHLLTILENDGSLGEIPLRSMYVYQKEVWIPPCNK